MNEKLEHPLRFPRDFRAALFKRVSSVHDMSWSSSSCVEFLGEIFLLEKLPSSDERCQNALQDIHLHTEVFGNYDLDDLLQDSRFNPTDKSDDVFHRFLNLSLHSDYNKYHFDRLKVLIEPMIEPIGMKIIELVEFGVSLGYQVVAGAVEASNQGRAHGKNPAPIEYNGLLFRSNIEVAFFKALFQAGYLVAPLPVFVHKPTYRRVEPDFVVVKYGIWAIIEIDGKPWHRETPAEAAKRLEPFTDENAKVIRVEAEEVMTAQGTEKVLKEIGRKFDNWQKAR